MKGLACKLGRREADEDAKGLVLTTDLVIATQGEKSTHRWNRQQQLFLLNIQSVLDLLDKS